MVKYPTYSSHKEAKKLCANKSCKANNTNQPHEDTGYKIGKWRFCCYLCRAFKYYDLQGGFKWARMS